MNFDKICIFLYSKILLKFTELYYIIIIIIIIILMPT